MTMPGQTLTAGVVLFGDAGAATPREARGHNKDHAAAAVMPHRRAPRERLRARSMTAPPPDNAGASCGGRSAWLAFSGRHRDDRRLGLDPLYALHTRLITALAREPRPFLSRDDVAFEEDLAATTGGGGFSRGLPFPEPYFAAPLTPTAGPGRQADEAAREALELLLGLRGRAGFERGREEEERQTSPRLRAYSSLRR
jgi:hypothetical protein